MGFRNTSAVSQRPRQISDRKKIEEERSSGRSMSYTILADCVAEGRTGEDTFRINFGPSDKVVQFQQNAREPIRLIRCPYS